jgi:hypothetical protein
MELSLMSVASFLVRVRGFLALSGMTELLLQKGEQIRQVDKAPALASVWAFEGCPPDQFTLATYLPQTQQVRYITSLFPAHLISPLFGWIYYTN